MAHTRASTLNFFSSMTNLNGIIRHKVWYYEMFEGAEFRWRYSDYGWTYSTIDLQIKVPWRFKKWLFLGPDCVWEKALTEPQVQKLLTIRRDFSYELTVSYNRFLQLAELYLSKQPNVEIESPEDDEEELQFLLNWKPDSDSERNPILVSPRTYIYV